MVVSARSGEGVTPDAALVSEIGAALEVVDRYRFNFSYVVDRATMLPVEHVLRYLTSAAARRSNSDATIRNKADGCYEFLLYLDAIDVDYRDVCFSTLIEYKERLSSYISPKTNRPLSDGTIKVRLQVAREFCAYHGVLPAAETAELKGKPLTTVARATKNAQDAALVVVNKAAPTEYVSTVDLNRLLAALGQAPEASCERPSRDWLLAVFCVVTGTRLGEALALTVNQILQAECQRGTRRSARVVLVKTKRSKPREIDVDGDLIDLLVQYIDGERREAVAFGLMHRHRTKETPALFVNGRDCAPRFAGLPYQAKRAEEYFAASQVRIGMTRIVPVYDPDTRRLTGERAVNRHTIHHLRHTYAVQAWHAYRDLPETDRWIRIQGQLGHSSYEVTAKVYLRAVKHFEATARDAMGAFYKSLLVLP